MEQALMQAKKAFLIDEVPIGAVIAKDDEIIGKGFNQRNTLGNTLKHAEMIAINEACENLGDWRLEQCTIYVTIEPCAMCSGAILQARIPKLIYGAKNAKAGCAGSVLNILQNDNFNHQVQIYRLMEEESAALMKDFFKKLRSSYV
jgi:tRNA(adenine34) deaminase